LENFSEKQDHVCKFISEAFFYFSYQNSLRAWYMTASLRSIFTSHQHPALDSAAKKFYWQVNGTIARWQKLKVQKK
jgi:hypothetical protein